MAEKKTPEKNPKKTETVFLPKEGRGDDRIWGAVNGKSFMIRKGEYVDVSPEIAEAVRNAQKMRAKGDAYIEEQQKKLNPNMVN